MWSRKFRALSIVSVLFMVAFLAFSAGCDGDKGSAGAQGEVGPAGDDGPTGPAGPQLDSVGEETCSYCHGEGAVADVEVKHGLADPAGFFDDTEFTGLSFAFGNMTVVNAADSSTIVFTITDETGNTFDLSASDMQDELEDGRIRIAVAQLTDAASGDASYWENFVVDDDGVPTYEGNDPADHDVGNITGTNPYTYTWKNNLAAGGNAGITFDNSKVIRVAIQTGGGSSQLPAGNYIADYDGLVLNTPEAAAATDDGQGTVTGTFARNVVDEASCNECHNPLRVHGRRTSTKYCPVCHNPTLEGGDGDLKVFVHKIHRGRYLPSVVAGGTYEFPEGRDWSDTGFPMFPLGDGLGIQNCTKCHDNGVAADADNWKDVPTMETCGSCHDDVDFSDGTNHLGGAQADNSGCANASCHGSTYAPEVVHDVPANYAAALNTVEFNIVSANYSDTTGKVTVEFYVSDPSNADAKYDLETDDPFDTDLGASINLSVAWDSSTDFFNEGSGSTPARSLDTNVLNALGTSAISDDGAGTYTMVITLPDEAQSSGSGMVFLQGHPLGDIDGDGNIEDGEEMPTDSVSKFFAITDSSATDRREIADIDKCNSCHGRLALHGDNRTNNLNVCAACHNPNHTDVNQRPDDATTTEDGKAEESVDFKRLIHAVHGSDMREEPIVIYGFGNNEHVFGPEEVTFPGELSDCTTCHEDEAYWLPLADDMLASTIDSGSDAADPSDDLNITQNAAVCSSCHDGAKAMAHMLDNGSAFDALDENIMFY